MRFAYVDGQEIDVTLVVGVELSDVANLATERRSSETAEDQYQRAAFASVSNMKARGTIQRHQPCIRGLISQLQVPAMHVR
jgi:hypothetical protein